MIYNKDLTNSLIEVFGDEVKEWSKDKVRSQLDDVVEEVNKLLLASENKLIREGLHATYLQVKDVDNTFMELFMKELDKVK